MNNDSAKTRQSTALTRNMNSSMKQQSSPAAIDGRTKSIKRKASSDKETPQKRKRVSENGEEPSQKRKRSLDLHLQETESTSSSVDTGRGSLSEGCIGMGGVKRKADDVEEPIRKRKRSPDLMTINKETEEDLTSSVEACRVLFEDKYTQEKQLGEGGCGSVFAGYRKADHLPVAIKHVPNDKQFCKQTDENGNHLSVEVAMMLKLRSAGHSAPVSMLDWYDLDEELILVLERPVPAVDLYEYIEANRGSLQEKEAMIILKQLLDATIKLHEEHIFHRDIKVENILIETGTDVPRVRLIDFGLSCFFKKRSLYSAFYGTTAHVPPEWYSRGTYRAGPTTVWQLGVVLFDMLHSYSFETKQFLDDQLKISTDLSNDCQDFLQFCLTKDPEQRPTLEQLQCHPWLR
ncbi:serine/threonine-protein kinase pim-1-like [Scomber scombrus]|uniref:Serine/threonine-protein kinase n=1 Tax=Scomber scombrus TaxID=13677 RepID=A0AAV1PJB9_SCOSC